MPATPPPPRAAALDAAVQAVAAARELIHDPSLGDEPPLEIVVALHVGTAIYGNIGAADRLDFTVIGPAVNLVSRIEAVAKAPTSRSSSVTISHAPMADRAAARPPRASRARDTSRSVCAGSVRFPHIGQHRTVLPYVEQAEKSKIKPEIAPRDVFAWPGKIGHLSCSLIEYYRGACDAAWSIRMMSSC